MSDSEQYIFGYGSLIESQSRALTSPFALHASPVNVVGIQRGWFGRLGDVGFSPTYLAAVPDPGSSCNGVIFKVSERELDAFDKYEAGYGREKLDPKNVIMLDDSKAAADGEIWFYTSSEKRFASPEFPIIQSYVDVCLSGCFEIEEKFPLAKEAQFGEEFLKTSTDWSRYWVNDRPHPRLVFPHQPNASRIDELIKKVLGEEMFSSIEIEPASWQRKRARRNAH
jgi:hypothetical protein